MKMIIRFLICRSTVEFDSLTYTVNENAGQVEVCVTVTSQNYNCPVVYDFSSARKRRIFSR